MRLGILLGVTILIFIQKFKIRNKKVSLTIKIRCKKLRVINKMFDE